MTYDNYEKLLVTRDGPILTVSLNNPPMNPIAGQRHLELSTIFDDIDKDDERKSLFSLLRAKCFPRAGM